jgi:hypothetical protein
MLLKRVVHLSCLIFVAFPALAQQSSTSPASVTKDPQAVSLAIASVAALSGNVQIGDVTLTGTGTRIAGSDIESGTFSLKGLGTGDSRTDLNLTSGLRSEIRNQDTGGPQGFLLTPGASVGSIAQHNCMTSAVWFFPALSVLSQTSDPTLNVVFVDQETKLGVAVDRIRFSLQSPNLSASDNLTLGQLTQTDVYLDSSSHLPVAMVFNTHPNNDALTNIVVEIDFSAYQTVNGVSVPFRIQQLLNNSLTLDLTVTSAGINQGLTDTDFSS